MKTFTCMAAQGDMMLIRVNSIPANAIPVAPNKGEYILAHSETGHNHVVMERPTVTLKADPVDQFRAYLVVTGDEPVELKHKRSFDTHESLAIQPGMYEIRRQREYTAEGFRKAQD